MLALSIAIILTGAHLVHQACVYHNMDTVVLMMPTVVPVVELVHAMGVINQVHQMETITPEMAHSTIVSRVFYSYTRNLILLCLR